MASPNRRRSRSLSGNSSRRGSTSDTTSTVTSTRTTDPTPETRARSNSAPAVDSALTTTTMGGGRAGDRNDDSDGKSGVSGTGRDTIVQKNKRDNDPITIVPTGAADLPPTASAPEPVQRNLDAHLPEMRQGMFDAAQAAFDAIYPEANAQITRWTERKKITQQQAAEMSSWISGVLTDREACGYARKQAMFFSRLVRAAQDLAQQYGLGANAGFGLDWLQKMLSMIESDGEATIAVAECLVERDWRLLDSFGSFLRVWVLRKLGVDGLNNAEGGLAGRFLCMLWNDGDYDEICNLIELGIDTAQPSYYGMVKPTGCEGVYSGHIQPIEHLLGNYLRLVSKQPLPQESVERETDDELRTLGARPFTVDGIGPTQARQRGVRKVAGAEQILNALRNKGTAKILTSFQDVEKSDLLKAFRQKPGTIWGFEDVRLPYVHAAHASPGGNQPLRMIELWQVVGLAMEQGWYDALMREPDEKIPELVEIGVKKAAETYAARPAEYYFWKLQDFEKAFRTQCTDYLRFLSEQPPGAKYTTAEERGHKLDTYTSAFYCKAALWWAQKAGATIYYCLDGVEDADVIGYKKLKNSRINSFLTDKDDNLRHLEVITLVEIREILKNWEQLKGTVRFARMGKFVDDHEISELKVRMKKEDESIPEDARKAPENVAEFEEAVREMDLEPKNLGPDLVMRLAAQSFLLWQAAWSKREQPLMLYLETKRSLVLYEQGLLPRGLPELYRNMINETNIELKKERGTKLISYLEESVDGHPRVCAYLRDPLIEAIRYHCGLPETPA